MFSNILIMFSLLSGIEVSYKTVERLYSDPEVVMAVHNLHILLLRKKGIDRSDTTGDGTGYSLTVKRNYDYESYAQELKERAKENGGNDGRGAKGGQKEGKHRRRLFAYMFAIMDLRTRMYVSYGSSMKSERDAFDRAMTMLSRMGVEVDSTRLDRYYSNPVYVDMFGGKVYLYIIPKRNSTLNGSRKWKETMREFVENTMGYLEEYHQRSNSEAGFAADKRMLGWNIAQRREDGIEGALFCAGLWHNLFNFSR